MSDNYKKMRFHDYIYDVIASQISIIYEASIIINYKFNITIYIMLTIKKFISVWSFRIFTSLRLPSLWLIF